jgi:Double-stranded RNA binding motif
MDNPKGGNSARGVVSDGEGDLSRDDSQQQQQQQDPPQNEDEGQEQGLAQQEPQQQQLPHQQHQQQQIPVYAQAWPHHYPINAGVPLPLPPNPHAIAMAQYYEAARMRDHVNNSPNGHDNNDQSDLIAQLKARIVQLEHQVITNSAPGAAAYASAAAGAAWAAAQMAAQAAEFASITNASAALALPPPPPMDVSALAAQRVSMDPHGMYPNNQVMYYPAGPTNGGLYMGPMAPLGSSLPPVMDPCDFYSNSGINGYAQHQHLHYEEDQAAWQQQQQQQESHQSNKRNNRNNHRNHEDDDGARRGDNGQDNADSYEFRNNRRKKLQRRPPGGITIPPHPSQRYCDSNHSSDFKDITQHPNAHGSNINNSDTRARRRLRDDHSSNGSCCSGSLGTTITSYNSDQAMGGAGLTNQNLNHGVSNGNSSSSGGQLAGNTYQRPLLRGSGVANHHCHRYKKKQRQPPCDASLLGKTAVAALHEWCNKRRMGQPSFVLLSHVTRDGGGGGDFEMAVYMEDGAEWGRGMGTSKASTKQAAARKALMALLPGVVFDPESGILVELPSPSPLISPNAIITGHLNRRRGSSEASASAEDLAPHLEQRLAIASGREDDYEEHNGKNAMSRSRPGKYGGVDYSSKKPKRTWNIYPGTTSTTNSEEDDENAWYASRGASVCSALLHAMVQIDERLPEGPQYAFVMSEMQTANAQMKRKGPASSSSGSAIVIHRGSFTCTATLKVLCGPEALSEVSQSLSFRAAIESNVDDKEDSGALGKPKQELANEELSETQKNLIASETQGTTQMTVLQAVAVGGSKRESKHTASAKLLAMLFPECKTMVEVKAAAEAAREKYAAMKSKKQQSKSSLANTNVRGRKNQRDNLLIPRMSMFQLNELCGPANDDPPLPVFYVVQRQSLLGMQPPSIKSSSGVCSQELGFEKLNLNQDSEGSNDKPRHPESAIQSENHLDARSATPSAASEEHTSLCRQLSRQKQLEERVVKALQVLNEHDEEGRSLPEEITVDDVGRTLLRRAQTPEDVERIRLLLRNDESHGAHAGDVPPASILGAAASGTSADFGDGILELDHDHGAQALRLWGSSTIVLLLCRAIAAFEDPPLGCAVLTLGFSMTKGRLLRVAQMGSEPHLPRERFLECLDAFAACMNCTLERQGADCVEQRRVTSVRLLTQDLEAIIDSHLGLQVSSPPSSKSAKEGQSPNIFSAPLESVLEESGGEYSDRSADATGKEKGRDKPSKRSRVE